MSNSLLRTVRCSPAFFSARHITSRTSVTEKLRVEDSNKGGIFGDVNHSKINIWWDLQRCHLPTHCDASMVISNIRDALRRIHLFGPIEFRAYGDMKLLLSQTTSQLHNRGVKLRHVPRSPFKVTEMERDYVMIADMMAWNTNHPSSPAIHLFMSAITTYEFATKQLEMIVDQFRAGGHETLIVARREEYDILPEIAGAKGIWDWETLVASPSCEDGFPIH